jgi:hypothetical protein
VQSRSSLTKVGESCSSPLLFPSRKSRASARSENLDTEVAGYISLYTFACISPRLITNNHSVAISGKTLHKTDANFRKIKSGVCQKRLHTKCKPKLAWRFTRPNSNQMTCEAPGYGPYRLRPRQSEDKSARRSGSKSCTQVVRSVKLCHGDNLVRYYNMAASTEPEQRLECLPNTKEESFRPLRPSGLHELRVFLITDNQSTKRTRKSGPSRSVFIIKHHTTTQNEIFLPTMQKRPLGASTLEHIFE